jgi:uncharacterized small protein (DUF1192 family)
LEQVTGKTETEISPDEQQFTRLLQGLWDRVRRAGDMVVQLRSQNADLAERVVFLEQELSRLKAELSTKDEQVKSLTERQDAAQSLSDRLFSNGDRESIAARAKELLARIEGYL